jgi:hypothetical protein
MKKTMFPKFYGINEIHTTQFTYCALMDDNMMYVGVDAQSNTKKKSEDLMLIFTREQIVEMYESMLSMEISNSKFLKK